MTDSPPDSPIDLHALVHYDAYQDIDVVKSFANYKKLCEVMGQKPVWWGLYPYYASKYSDENLNSTRDFPDIRGCIYSDILEGKSVEISYNDLSEAFKTYGIDTDIHNYWFKWYTRVTFSDLPNEIIARVVEKCDLDSFLNLRKVSQWVQDIVDQQAPPCTNILVYGSEEEIKVNTDDWPWKYIIPQLPAETFEKRLFEKVEPLLRNPKLRLKSIDIKCSRSSRLPSEQTNYIKPLYDILNSLNHKIHVEECSIEVSQEKEFMDILQSFKPGTLEKMKLAKYYPPIKIDKIAEMEQWKQAKHVESFLSNELSIDSFLHFSTFETSLPSTFTEDILELCDKLFESINFEHCVLHSDKFINPEEIRIALNLQTVDTRHLNSISDTNPYLQFSFNIFSFKITKL